VLIGLVRVPFFCPAPARILSRSPKKMAKSLEATLQKHRNKNNKKP